MYEVVKMQQVLEIEPRAAGLSCQYDEHRVTTNPNNVILPFIHLITSTVSPVEARSSKECKVYVQNTIIPMQEEV